MATRQVASAPEIATGLRAVHNINVLVRSITEADYVISWQLGVLRVMMSGEKLCMLSDIWISSFLFKPCVRCSLCSSVGIGTRLQAG
jgi:hypothetical protein